MGININKIIEGVEEGTTEVIDEHDYHEVEYIDGVSDRYIVHKVNIEEMDLKVLFAERDYVTEFRDELYQGNKTYEDLIYFIGNLNDLDGEFNYDKVVGYKVDDGIIEWVKV